MRHLIGKILKELLWCCQTLPVIKWHFAPSGHFYLGSVAEVRCSFPAGHMGPLVPWVPLTLNSLSPVPLQVPGPSPCSVTELAVLLITRVSCGSGPCSFLEFSCSMMREDSCGWQACVVDLGSFYKYMWLPLYHVHCMFQLKVSQWSQASCKSRHLNGTMTDDYFFFTSFVLKYTQ